MSTIQLLRAFVNQRLTVAVEEIIGLFERTITEYEEEIDRQRRLLGAEGRQYEPDIRAAIDHQTGVSQDVQPLIVNAKIPAKRQELSPRLEQEAPQPLRIKEEPGDVWTGQEGGLEGTDVPEFQFPPVSVKSENDEETPQSSELQQSRAKESTYGTASSPAQQTELGAAGEDRGEPDRTLDMDVARFLKATSNGQFFLSQCFKADPEVLDDDWNKMIKSQPFSDTLTDSEAASHKRSQKKLYKCPICSKTFQHNTALQRHMTCHTGERPFDCAECGKTFRQKGSLHIHMRKHTGEKPFSCLVCGKNFTQSGTLAAHMRIHTGEKPFSCSVCKKRYNERGTLVRHMRVHTGEKPFTCSLCGKRFSEKGNLNKHKRIHTGEKPFSCSLCEKKFSLFSHLKNHKCPGKKSSEAAELQPQLQCPNVTEQVTRYIHESVSSLSSGDK
ncbi:zinc finger protein 135-like isoform X1 [Seriola lalandi dorsalis]|uniref:Zinc finger protein 135-like n=1 Tax=Seriola lalandi dorsalis TaxID=1841481 RepID=A0A3B4YFZ5_SERLL|nr:zinc finger protein 135-like isoform X1 [Seriola lalandi dorsalis]